MDVAPELGALLHNMEVTDGTTTAVVFPYVPWGEHWGFEGSKLTIQSPSHPTSPGNIGGGVDNELQDLQIHGTWGGEPGITDMDVFRRGVKEGIKAIVRANAKSVSPAWWLQVGNTVNLDEPSAPDPEGPVVNVYEIAVIVRANAVVTY